LAESALPCLGAGDRLKHEIDRRALADQAERGGDMRQDASLRRDVELSDNLIEHRQQSVRARRTVGRRIDTDHRIARAEEKPVENAGRDAARVVGRMIGLQPHR
jgi:hypothetical protein